MRIAAASCFLFAAVCSGVSAKDDAGIAWPENGVVKFSHPDSPTDLTLELPGCLRIFVDWPNDAVAVTVEGRDEDLIAAGKEVLRADGGKIVVLITVEGGELFVILYLEDGTGGYDTRQISMEDPGCRLSKLIARSRDLGKLKAGKVFITDNIANEMRSKLGVNA